MEPLTIFQAIKNSIDIIRSLVEFRDRSLEGYERTREMIEEFVENCKIVVDDYFMMFSKLEAGMRKKTTKDEKFQTLEEYFLNRQKLLSLRRQMYVEIAELLKVEIDPELNDFFIAASRILDVSDSRLAIPGQPNSVSRFVVTESVFNANFDDSRRKTILENVDKARTLLEQRWQELISALARLKISEDVDWGRLVSYAKWSKRKSKS